MIAKIMLTASLAMALAGAVNAQEVAAKANCKLSNTAAGKSLYDGPCMVTQSASGDNTIFKVQMNNGSQPFIFAGVKGQSNWMHGPERTDFTDLPGGGIFRWGDFVLAVAQ